MKYKLKTLFLLVLLSGLFSTHPPVKERIRRLLGLREEKHSVLVS